MHKFDYRFQKPDHRDFKFTPPLTRAALPPSFNLTPPDVDDQGQEGSCGPNSVDGLLKFDMNKQGVPVYHTSRQFTYWITRVLMGTTTEDSGVDNRTMLKALNGSGFCKEDTWPYSEPLTTQPSQAAFNEALPNKITSYATVDQNLVTMKNTLVSGFPFLFGFSVYNQIESQQAAQDGKIAMPSGSSIGGHDVVIYGWDDNVLCPGTSTPGAFKLLNSWGTSWGVSGSGWIPYAYAIDPNQAGDFWVINAIPVPTPVPPSPPVPPTPIPSPTTLFTFQLVRKVRDGSTLSIRHVPEMEVGEYGVVDLNAFRV